MAARRYWLIKSEPETYSIDDLARDGSTPWDGVRNYTARNFLRDEMQAGDGVLFYHSSCEPPGIAGVARVAGPSRPDPSQFDDGSAYYDPKSTEAAPRWHLVDVEFVAKLDRYLPLAELKDADALDGMPLLQKGQRLSVQPVDERHWRTVLEMAGASDLA